MSVAMSAELYRSVQTQCVEASRIPVASPSYGFRRCSSMRLRGERPNTLRIRGQSVSAGATPASQVKHGTAGKPPSDNTTSNGQLRDEQNSRVRSLSLSLSTPRLSTGARSPAPRDACTAAPTRVRTRSEYLPPDEDLDDLDSLNSYASGASTASCEHPFVAHNGTTFSGRRMRYVVHCSAHAGQTGEDYLTPTQRAQRQIKRLKYLLGQAKRDIEQKDSDIFRLTKEVVELRLYKATLCSPDSPNSSEAVTVRENATEDAKTPDSPTCATDMTDDAKTPGEKDMHSSCADSGHFEDLSASKDSVAGPSTSDKACLARLEPYLPEEYERRLEKLVRSHGDDTNELRQRHNEKVEELLQRLSEANARYGRLVPDYEQARDRIQELEKQLDEVTRRLEERENLGDRLGDQTMAIATHSPSRVSVSDLLQQLQVTQNELDNIKDTEFASEHSPDAQSLLSAKEAVSLWVLGARKAMYRRLVETRSSKNTMDPEITLQFLKSAIYYFLTDKENHQGHLKAIQSILGFTPAEISNIDKARSS